MKMSDNLHVIMRHMALTVVKELIILIEFEYFCNGCIDL